MRSIRRVLQERGLSPDDVEEAIHEGRVLVDGRPVLNPNSQVRPAAAVVVRPARVLRGTTKLQAALQVFPASIRDRVALDLGASAGGFTTALLRAGARRVYAVDVGHGQLVGSLRQDPRVVNLESTNLAALDAAKVPDTVDVVTADLSFLSLTDALPQLGRVRFADRAELIGLVKPMFELQLPQPPEDEPSLQRALDRARRGVEAAGWEVTGELRSPVLGARGAVEFFLHARRQPPTR